MRSEAETLVWCRMKSPVGELTLVRSHRGLRAVLWDGDRPTRVPLSTKGRCDAGDALLARATRQLEEYFSGSRFVFDLPLDPVGTPFQRQVWDELARIPYGVTRSYGELARALGDEHKARAVGAANGRNPLSIVVPCHRVIGKNGALVGFAGGLGVKEKLLTLEKQMRKTHCQRCHRGLPTSEERHECHYRCTFCAQCTTALEGTCPNCGGALRRFLAT